ncbi:MAG: hypothetical protein QOE84_1112 [Actinomycetota bacterium]|nr:hypothetical protein [Actinomycetota bacterium]
MTVRTAAVAGLAALVLAGCGGSSTSTAAAPRTPTPTATAAASPTATAANSGSSPVIVSTNGVPIELHRPFSSGVSIILYPVKGGGQQIFVAHDNLLRLQVDHIHLPGGGRMDIFFTPATIAALRRLPGVSVYPTAENFVLTAPTSPRALAAAGHLLVTVKDDTIARGFAKDIAGTAPVD